MRWKPGKMRTAKEDGTGRWSKKPEESQAVDRSSWEAPWNNRVNHDGAAVDDRINGNVHSPSKDFWI